MRSRSVSKNCIFLILCLTVSAAAMAGEGRDASVWPYGKTINLVVSYAAGGDADLSARLLSEHLGKELGVDVVVTNISGGNGAIAMDEVISRNDPFTFLVINTASLSANPVTGLSDLTYKDMDCVSIYGRYSGETFYVPVDAPYNTFEEFIEYARQNKVSVGVATGGALYAACCAMMADAKMDLTLIDAGDGVERIVQVANRNLDSTFASFSNGREYVASGYVKQLATLMADRLDIAPEMPSVSEYIPSSVVNTLFVILSPAGANSENDLKAFATAIMDTYEKQPGYKEAYERYFYQNAKPYTREESLEELEVQYNQFQKYAPYLN